MFLSISCVLLFCTKDIKSQSKERLNVVLLAGQSNMAGAGNFDELELSVQKRIEKVSNRVLVINNGKPPYPLSYYKNKPSLKYPFKKRFGPELLLGLKLAEKYPNDSFLMIKRSQGGTSLHGAWNPKWTKEKAKLMERGEKKQNLRLYDMHINDIKINLKKDKNCKIIGLFWMQGENDATSKTAANNYYKNLKRFVNSYKKDLKIKKLPFVFGQINSRYGVKKGAGIVRKNMERYATSNTYSRLIKTSTNTTWKDFPKHKDNVHYNTEGQKRLGIAFATAFFEIENVLKF